MTLCDVRSEKRRAPLSECFALPTRQGSLALHWLGQAGFALRGPDSLIVIDPYLSDSLADKYRGGRYPHTRMSPAPVAPEELRGIHLLLATHAHSDHLDPGSVGTIMAVNPDCLLVCPAPVVPKALERGAAPDRVVGMKAFEKRRFGPVELEMLPSAHEELRVGPGGETDCAGFAIGVEGMRLYHSGDCVPFAGLSDMLRGQSIGAALLPVNGRSEALGKNGILGNFSVEEAAEICLAAGIGVLVPHHFGLFDFNTVRPEEIAARLEPFRTRGLCACIPDAEHCLVMEA